MVTDPAFRALADPTRRALLDRLSLGPQPVHELARHFPMSRPAISKHLRLLREAGLVVERRDGRESFYAVNAGPLRDVDEWISKYRAMWQSRLTRLKAHVEGRRERRTGTEARESRPAAGTRRGQNAGEDR